MTGTQLFAKALSLNDQTTLDTDYSDDLAINMINFSLWETFDANNSIRLFLGKEKLTVPQQITSLSETLTYEDKITNTVLPYGVISKLFATDEGTLVFVEYFEKKYSDNLNLSAKPRIVRS